jgi:hypothetical protein
MVEVRPDPTIASQTTRDSGAGPVGRRTMGCMTIASTLRIAWVAGLVAASVTVPVAAEATPAAGGCATVSGGSNAVLGHITDVRVGRHRHFDRFVVEFGGHRMPHYSVDPQPSSNFRLDPSNRQVQLRGTAGIRVVFSHSTGVGSYHGPADFRTGFPELREARRLGDFEAVTTWGLGLGQRDCGKVFTLRQPRRLVIDVAH